MGKAVKQARRQAVKRRQERAQRLAQVSCRLREVLGRSRAPRDAEARLAPR